ncbi:MAG: peptidylprolyl isomerase [Pseudomonadota bacterium]
MRLVTLLTVVSGVLLSACAMGSKPSPELTMSAVLEASTPDDWRRTDPNLTLYMTLPGGTVIIELAPDFAPAHTKNILTLVDQRYFDGLAIVRSQENYVVQWGDPAEADKKRSLGQAKSKLDGEYFRAASGLDFTRLNTRDSYANEVGFVDGFPAGRDDANGRAWLAHCNAMLGAGRDVAADSGNGQELYVVIGHAPRHLDRNVTLVGRVIDGMQHLSTLPRGTGSLGFYETAAERTSILSIRRESQLADDKRQHLELLRTDTETFKQLIQARQHRLEEWFIDPAGQIGLCNVPLPVRAIANP